ncbi:MAG: hypothetical protein AAF368_03425, partial [Planctomycetota bacterium]
TETADQLRSQGRLDLFFKFVFQWLEHSIDSGHKEAFLRGLRHLRVDSFLLANSELCWLSHRHVLPGFQLLAAVFRRCDDAPTKQRISELIFGNKRVFITLQELNAGLGGSRPGSGRLESQLVLRFLVSLISQSLDFRIKHTSPVLELAHLQYLKRLFCLLTHSIRQEIDFDIRSLVEMETLAETAQTVRLLFEFLLQNDQFDVLDAIFEPLSRFVNSRHRFNINQKNVLVARFYLQVLKVL